MKINACETSIVGGLGCRRSLRRLLSRSDPGLWRVGLAFDTPGSVNNDDAAKILCDRKADEGMLIEHRIVCVEAQDGRLSAVGTGGDDGVAHRRWTIAEVRRAVGEGERFFMLCPATGLDTDVEVHEQTLRTDPRALGNPRLLDLRSCRWR
jgi:hypothetical protein